MHCLHGTCCCEDNYDSMNRVTEVVNSIGVKNTYTYNAEGFLSESRNGKGEKTSYTYDCRNRLVKVKEEDGRTTVYEYDAEDIRTASVTGGVRTEYITDREAVYSQVLVKTSYGKNVFGVYNEERERITYTYGAGLINERRAGGEEYVYHYNHLGSAVAITDGNGEIVFRIVYGTYGELYDIRNAGGVSLLTAETAEGCTAAEVGYALGMEYLYNGQYGVSTGGNGLYYMRARYYDQDIKRFINRDILSGNIGNSQSLNRYCYVQGNPVSLTDPFGLCPTRAEVYKNRALKWLHTALDVGGILFDGFDYVNVLLYHFEGRDTEAAITLLCLIPVMGNFLALPVRLTLKLGSNAGEALVKLGKKYLPDLMENGSRFLNWAGGKIDDVWRWIQKKLGKAGIEDNRLTGTVWDSINPTQSNIRGTEIPQSFEIMVDGEIFWVHPNGTKHMGEYIARNATSHGMPINSQALLTSFQNAVNTAYAEGIRYEQIMKVGNWELIFSRPRTEGLLPVIKHALYRP